MKLRYAFGGIFLATSMFTACVTTPETHRMQLNFQSDATMNDLGAQAYKDTLAKSKISQNAALNNQVMTVAKRIAAASGADFDWQFTVVQSDEVNAFCLPGGKIVVYTALVPIAKNNAGLAAVLGHEVAHAVLRHSAERMSQAEILQQGLNLSGAVFSTSAYKDTIAAVLGIGANYGVALPFSRFHESEADRVGLEYMAKAGYDPREALALWQRMNQLSGSRPPELLSDHPNPENREKDLAKQMDKALALYNASVKQPTTNLVKP